MGRTSSVQAGEMAGAIAPRRADNIPAIKVPWRQAMLPACVHAPAMLPEMSRIVAPARSGWLMSTGPSINPTSIAGLPPVRSINGVSLTNAKASIGRSPSVFPSCLRRVQGKARTIGNRTVRPSAPQSAEQG